MVRIRITMCPVTGRHACALVLALLSLGARAADSQSAAREAFVAAHREAVAGLPAPDGGDGEALRQYPLYPYLQAARLEHALRGATGAAAGELPADTEARRFLAEFGAEPVGRIVRAAWLASLAERSRWREFLDAYEGASSTGQTLRCQALTARIRLSQAAAVADDAIREWLTPASAEDACDPVFEWMRAEGILDAALIERRARLALAGGESRLARWLAKSLPEDDARPLRDWATLIEQPQAAIDALIRSPDVAVEAEAMLAGWTRLSRRNPDAARDRYDALVAARGFDLEAASPYARALALGLAWSRKPGALRYFALTKPADYDDLAYEWRVRAALWAGNWTEVAAAVESMPPPLRDESRWRYWLARAAEATGQRERSLALYSSLIPTDNWYAVLAAARAGKRFSPHDRPIGFDRARVAELEHLPPFLRARELLHAGLYRFAPAEWREGMAGLDASGKLAAIAMASDWGWHFQSIATAAEQRIFDDYALLYPRPFDPEVAAAAGATGLPQTLIYAVIRQESLYQPYAVSSAGAVGLMQLLPSTAKRVARTLRQPRPGTEDLKSAGTNLPLGAAYLAGLIDQFGGQVVVALAGYNAGPTAARRWLPDQSLAMDIWVENIPFNETRAYVQRIMWHSVVFEWRADGEPEDASAWLVKVSPPAG